MKTLLEQMPADKPMQLHPLYSTLIEKAWAGVQEQKKAGDPDTASILEITRASYSLILPDSWEAPT
eukprot:13898153-Alexandrium_andersonii.AAC.1